MLKECISTGIYRDGAYSPRSGLPALAKFAFQCSIGLHSTVQSYQFHPKRVRDLIEELEALSGVLRALTSTVDTTTDVDLSALELPLRRCGIACKEFEEEIKKCSSRSGGSRTSFRDWAKLTYMDDNIDGFKQLLAGYKSTINIALMDASLRRSSVTAEELERHRTQINTTTDDLEAHLQSIDEKFEAIFGRTVTHSDSDAKELQRIKEERLSTQKCLEICAQLSDHIGQIRIRPAQSSSAPGPIDPEPLPERVTNQGLEDCKDSLKLTSAKLERHMHDLMERLMTKSKSAMSSEKDLADLARLRDEWETTRQCQNICSEAETRLKENISVIENHATGDEAIQFMVSTNDKTIHGRNEGTGDRIRQVGGHFNDDSLQQLSRDLAGLSIPRSGNNVPSSRGNTPPVRDDGLQKEPTPEFKDRFGQGFKLPPKSSPNTARDDGVSSQSMS
ncbi:hypothetical protein G7Z17_g10531 [Cylindrodendrum hubeiense]|uniref:Azaphilone pigments biosynthesis cluster protein L N-terminal domain-containing protein n=1 Tax=Cylindrodendrum hubeiense TaxID=595255 RepID=A0A9P5GXI7_9HYPO|nr:hypothetical protein G7Z17_g10531 [Cylindrodendrum hubeiense]